MRPLFLALGLWTSLVVTAQTNPPTPLRRDESREKTLLSAIDARYKSDLSRLSGPNRKRLAEIYGDRLKTIQALFSGNLVVTDPEASDYLNALLGEIARANPEVPVGDLRVLFSNAWWPNAMSMGEGTILFNAGLFHRLRNESQAAFVLCHELAHYLLNHGNDGIARYVEVVYSDSVQKKLKSIQKQEYRQNQQLEVLARSLAFGSRRHGRAHEHEADSMAVALLRRTSFDPAEALSCLALLDSVDSDKYQHPLELERRFTSDVQTFRKSWLESDALSFATTADATDEAEKDSLKTHPDCQKRIARLAGLVPTSPGARKNPVRAERFESLRTRFDRAIIQACFDNKQVSRALYLTLRMLGEQPDDLELKVMAGRCLNEIHDQQKAHQLGRYVDLPGPEYEKEYNGLLHLIQNLRLREIAVMTYQYLLPYRAQLEANPAYLPVWKRAVENLN